MTADLVRRLEALAQEVDYEPEGTELGPLAAVLEFLHEPEVYEALRALPQPGGEAVAECPKWPGCRCISESKCLNINPPAGDAGDWRTVAFCFAERLIKQGPPGAYEMSPDDLLEWVLVNTPLTIAAPASAQAGETPETDAAKFPILSDMQSGTRDVVDADFARGLEIQRNEARKENDNEVDRLKPARIKASADRIAQAGEGEGGKE